VSLDARFMLDGKGVPQGLDGRLAFGGSQELGGFTLQDAQFLVGFGPGKSYLAATTAGSFKGIAAEVKAFLGRTCALDPLLAVDGGVLQVLALPEVGFADAAGNLTGSPAGFYLSSGGWFPMERLLDLPTTCALSLRAHAVHGWFGFVKGNHLDPDSLRFVYGQRELWGLEGKVLCSIGVTGQLTMLGAVAADPLRPETAASGLRGEIKVGARLGICPVCDTFEKTFGVIGVVSRSGIRFELED